MRLPRIRFTVRRMMIFVAIAALSLVFLVPIFSKLRYLYNTPYSASFVWTNVVPRGPALIGPAIAGQPVPIHCLFDTTFSDRVPSGIPYQVTIEVQMIDRKTGIVEETHRQSRYVRAGKGVARAELNLNLTPSHAGDYRVRYEGTSHDLVGRKSTHPGIATQWFEAR
jgi:hypothetical protein